MNFDDNPQEAAYRAQVRAWIEANVPDMIHLTPDQRKNWHPAHKAVAHIWQKTKAEAGYACISWPKERGGAGGSAIEEAIFNQEEARAGIQFTYFMTGLHMLLPALMEFSTDEAALARIAPAVRGEEVWCQLFSEPSSGSDSAATRTAAVRDGDPGSGSGTGDWVINGQKVWNSGAQVADYGMVITRTDPDLPKHKGLTAFWLDMKTPGVEVRPIKMMSGDDEFNEVFFTDVRIPDSQRVGGVNEGWKVVISTLMNERASLGSGTGLSWRDIMALAKQSPAWGGSTLADPAFREWLADYYVSAEAVRLLSFRNLTALSKGHTPGPEGSAGKLLWSGNTQDLTNQALDMLDQFGLVDGADQAAMGGAFQHRFLWSPGLRLGGGTDEIMKNIIAERVLGLPGEPRVDKNVPFRDIPSGR
jgi:alkylation response protein AidB-like acyl-CoA dehydrogenase